ncbi:hypothetical protein ColLi_12374 [Colletotrichum liriopes]|uniref:Uncharacterized protein n=1 Tax=Colletotrichum liriopes TaxID=708192 RepID=A0AA37GY98_9PEZI|nr:hypothetical protein ColLi_12374 [Colletotrichum liriopes]
MRERSDLMVFDHPVLIVHGTGGLRRPQDDGFEDPDSSFDECWVADIKDARGLCRVEEKVIARRDEPNVVEGKARTCYGAVSRPAARRQGREATRGGEARRSDAWGDVKYGLLWTPQLIGKQSPYQVCETSKSSSCVAR